MAKVCFASTIKYNGNKYLPNVPFEADDKDVPELKAKGCWVIEETHNPVKLVKEQPADVEEEQVEVVKPKATKKSSTGAKKKGA